MRPRTLIAVAALIVALPASGWSEPTPEVPKEAVAKSKESVLQLPTRKLVLDLSVPESPAFEVLGFTPERVTRPTSPRELAANLLNGVDESGNLQTGIAIDTTPYLLFKNHSDTDVLTLQAYRNDQLTRWAARTQFSLATTKGATNDDESVRLGVGLKTTLWDAGDPRLDDVFANCLAGAHALVHASLDELLGNDAGEMNVAFGHTEGDGTLEFITDVLVLRKKAIEEAESSGGNAEELLRKKVMAALAAEKDEAKRIGWTNRIVYFAAPDGKLLKAQEITKTCFDEAKARNWNAPSWDVGGALSWISGSGEVKDLTGTGGAAWTSIALNLPDETWWGLAGQWQVEHHEGYLSDFVREHFQLILHARYRGGQDVPDPDASDSSATTNQNVALVGGRLRVGTAHVAFSAEAAYTDTKLHGNWDGSLFYSIGAEFQIAKDLWLQVSAGSQSGNDSGSDEATILGSIKYGFSSSSPFEAWEALQAQ